LGGPVRLDWLLVVFLAAISGVMFLKVLRPRIVLARAARGHPIDASEWDVAAFLSIVLAGITVGIAVSFLPFLF
jgi:hypothetical protein